MTGASAADAKPANAINSHPAMNLVIELILLHGTERARILAGLERARGATHDAKGGTRDPGTAGLCRGPAAADDIAATRLAQAETAFAEAMDAAGIQSAIDSGLVNEYSGHDRAYWSVRQQSAVTDFERLDVTLQSAELAADDARALANMHRKLALLEPAAAVDSTPAARCQDAQSAAAGYDALRAALYACFDELGNAIEFEGSRHTRVAALGMLAEIDDPERRKRLFQAFVPLWQAVNSDDSRQSPYRRMIALAAASTRESGSEIDAAARTLGVTAADVERWLERVLDAWATAIGDERVEPWDYRYVGRRGGPSVADRDSTRNADVDQPALLRGSRCRSRCARRAVRPRAAIRQGSARLRRFRDARTRGRRTLAPHGRPRFRQLCRRRARAPERARPRERARRAHDGGADAARVHGSRRQPVHRGIRRRAVVEHVRAGVAAQVRRSSRHPKRCRSARSTRGSCSTWPGRCSSAACCARREPIRTRSGPRSPAVICGSSRTRNSPGGRCECSSWTPRATWSTTVSGRC